MKVIQKRPITMFRNVDEEKYYKLLTPYAFNFIKQNLFCPTKEILKDTALDSCSCSFYKSMRLPCRHIINKRRVTNNSIFVENRCDVRWTRNYYIKSHPPEQTDLNIEIEIQRPKKSQKMLTAPEKYRKASIQTAKLAELLSEVSQFSFERRICQLLLIEEILLNNSAGNYLQIINTIILY